VVTPQFNLTSIQDYILKKKIFATREIARQCDRRIVPAVRIFWLFEEDTPAFDQVQEFYVAVDLADPTSAQYSFKEPEIHCAISQESRPVSLASL
jgi:hypothetical protein